MFHTYVTQGFIDEGCCRISCKNLAISSSTNKVSRTSWMKYGPVNALTNAGEEEMRRKGRTKIVRLNRVLSLRSLLTLSVCLILMSSVRTGNASMVLKDRDENDNQMSLTAAATDETAENNTEKKNTVVDLMTVPERYIRM